MVIKERREGELGRGGQMWVMVAIVAAWQPRMLATVMAIRGWRRAVEGKMEVACCVWKWPWEDKGRSAKRDKREGGGAQMKKESKLLKRSPFILTKKYTSLFL